MVVDVLIELRGELVLLAGSFSVPSIEHPLTIFFPGNVQFNALYKNTILSRPCFVYFVVKLLCLGYWLFSVRIKYSVDVTVFKT